MPREKKLMLGGLPDEPCRLVRGSPDDSADGTSWSDEYLFVWLQVNDNPNTIEFSGEAEQYQQVIEALIEHDIQPNLDDYIVYRDKNYRIVEISDADADFFYSRIVCVNKKGDSVNGHRATRDITP